MPAVSKFKKLYQKLKSGRSDGNISFADADYLLTNSGFEAVGSKGSHRTYRHPDGRKITLPFHGKDMKRAYVEGLRETI
ncbi:MAG: type II toxin-antitoxin system HicA family toxin [Verrucomicrobiales bacterium]|jgi:predicted RNA binding protein YcfA (HicA-like mRNA interferase family)|nr:type II toxin-antitoxin system HicA family toxin [Verrucomicrobiales bacterium]